MAKYTGIEIEWAFGADETLTVERDTSGGFGGAVTTTSGLTGGTQYVTDPLPLGTTDYYYRAYVARSGFGNSSYSATVGPVRPVVLV